MYLTKSLVEGLRILGFDKETIKKVSRERSLEEIFLSTLFMNYIIVLIVYAIIILMGEIKISGREVNNIVLFGLLMVYPFAYNIAVYTIYGIFGLIAELINTKKTIKPLISVGFHTGIVYTIIFYIIALLSTFNVVYGLFLFIVFTVYFIYTMFLAIKVIYDYSQAQTLIVLFIPFLILFMIVLIVQIGYGDVLVGMFGDNFFK